jgi:excisionase family DNA binding protein
VIIPQGDGSFVVKPGKPVEWLSPAQFARQFGLDRSTIYRAIREGTIPSEFVEPIGKRKYRIAAAAMEHVRQAWRARWENR